MTKFNFRTGGAAAEEADQAVRDAGKGTGPKYFKIENDGDKITARFVTDEPDWIWVAQHSFVPTKPAPKDGGDNWPRSMMSVCRHDEAFAGHYTDCYTCDNKLKNTFGKTATPQVRVWALAVEREIVTGDGTEALGGESMKGMVVGVRDKIEEIDELGEDGKPTGTTLRYPKILIINQPVKSFFGPLRSLYGLYKTVCDRDMVITRDGTGTDTSYRFSPIDPIDEVKPGTPAWEKYQQVLTERDISLGTIVADHASDAYYARFFDPAFDVDKDGTVVPAGSVPVAAGSDPAPAATGLDPDLKARIRNLGAPSKG